MWVNIGIEDVHSLFLPRAVILVNVVCVLEEFELFIIKQLAKRAQPEMYQRVEWRQCHDVINTLGLETCSRGRRVQTIGKGGERGGEPLCLFTITMITSIWTHVVIQCVIRVALVMEVLNFRFPVNGDTN